MIIRSSIICFVSIQKENKNKKNPSTMTILTTCKCSREKKTFWAKKKVKWKTYWERFVLIKSIEFVFHFIVRKRHLFAFIRQKIKRNELLYIFLLFAVCLLDFIYFSVFLSKALNTNVLAKTSIFISCSLSGRIFVSKYRNRSP